MIPKEHFTKTVGEGEGRRGREGEGGQGREREGEGGQGGERERESDIGPQSKPYDTCT